MTRMFSTRCSSVRVIGGRDRHDPRLGYRRASDRRLSGHGHRCVRRSWPGPEVQFDRSARPDAGGARRAIGAVAARHHALAQRGVAVPSGARLEPQRLAGGQRDGLDHDVGAAGVALDPHRVRAGAPVADRDVGHLAIDRRGRRRRHDRLGGRRAERRVRRQACGRRGGLVDVGPPCDHVDRVGRGRRQFDLLGREQLHSIAPIARISSTLAPEPLAGAAHVPSARR